MHSTQYTLDAGVLTVKHTCSIEQLSLMLDVGQRINPKRPFLFVSKVLGRHIPVKPSVMKSSFDELAGLASAHVEGKALCIGMAETAVGLGAGVHQSLRELGCETYFISSTRYPVNKPIFCYFKEEHSHASDHTIHIPTNSSILAEAQTLILVDDEASTGKTFYNLISSLVKAGLDSVKHIVTVTLTDWSDNAIVKRVNDSPDLQHLSVNNVSLLNGSWHWQSTRQINVDEVAFNKNNITMYVGENVRISKNECRTGFNNSEFTPPEIDIRGHKVLVLATGEYAWQPYLVASFLEKKGYEVYLSSTSRSPVEPKFAIKAKHELQDNYGQGIDMFAYNIEPEHYDHIIICSETDGSLFDSHFLQDLKTQANCVEVLHCE